jgi:hypothetical protein
MSDSETSSDIKINMYDNKGQINNNTKSEQKKSSDTDYYNNLLANDNKIVPEKKDVISDSELESSSTTESRKSSSISSSSSSSRKSNSSRKKGGYENINFGSSNFTNKNSESSFNNKTSVPSVPTMSSSMTSQEIRMKKIELLRKLSEIKAKGFSLTKEYDFSSSIEEMEYEYELLKSYYLSYVHD